MKPCYAFLFLFGLAHAAAYAASVPIEAHAHKFKGKFFVMRLNEAVLGTPQFSQWDGRPIYFAGARTLSQTRRDWEGHYFVFENSYTVKDVSYEKKPDQLVLKFWGPAGRELRLSFSSAKNLTIEEFDALFFTIFLRESEAAQEYIQRNEDTLIERYLDQHPELLVLPLEERRKILRVIKTLGRPPKPALEKLGRDIYLPVLLIESVVYNDIQVSKNQRIASSIEAQIPGIKSASSAAAKLPVIGGIRFYWETLHRDFLRETYPRRELVELLVSLDVLQQLTAGDLSAFELIQKSYLRIDGTKFTLTSYEPIGAR